MSETDSFIEEVTEEVRRDKLYGYARKYGWIAVVLILAVVGTTAYLEWQKNQNMTAARSLGDRILAATSKATAAERATALAEIKDGSPMAQSLVALRQAAEMVAAGDKGAALAVLDELARSAPTALYRDLASLKALILRGADMDGGARSQALAALAQPGQVFRPLALEQQAIMAIEQGNSDQAITLLSEVYLDSQSTAALQSRVRQMIVALGGTVPVNPELLLSQ